MLKDEIILTKRLKELSAVAFQRDIVTFSDFLNLNELNILHTLPKDMLSSKYICFGGYEYSERQMAAFIPDALSYDYKYPVSIMKVTPLNHKFAENLGHRDYLGAVLNLGIERSKIGDILVLDDSSVIFCHDSMAGFLAENLTRIRHTAVSADRIEETDFQYTPKFEEIKGTVASVRLDALLSLAFGSSRSKLTAYIENGKVFVNGRLVTSNGCQIHEKDIVSVRGLGRFVYDGLLSQTKKGRNYITIRKYV